MTTENGSSGSIPVQRSDRTAPRSRIEGPSKRVSAWGFGVGNDEVPAVAAVGAAIGDDISWLEAPIRLGHTQQAAAPAAVDAGDLCGHFDIVDVAGPARVDGHFRSVPCASQCARMSVLSGFRASHFPLLSAPLTGRSGHVFALCPPLSFAPLTGRSDPGLSLYRDAVRVVGGALGGRHLETAGTDAVRPTSDRAREAIFNMLVSLDLPGGTTALDLFAGSGALGIEALSRDAGHATFVDSDAAACRSITANLAALGISDRATVVRSDVVRFLAAHDDPVDLAFADPPYRFDSWRDLLEAVNADVLVCESDREIEPSSHHGWRTHRVRRYGTPVVTVLVRPDGADVSTASG